MIAEIESVVSRSRLSRGSSPVKLLQPGAVAADRVMRALDLPGRSQLVRLKPNALPVQFSETRFTPRIVHGSPTH